MDVQASSRPGPTTGPRAGVYRGSSVPQDGLLVHSLEHGYVVLWHAPALGDEQRGQLADLERAHDGDVIVAERTSLPVPVATTAWGHRLLCQTVEPAALERFVDEHVGNGRRTSSGAGRPPATRP